MNRTIYGWYGRDIYPNLPRTKETTVDEATPEEVAARKAKRLDYLRKEIERCQERIAAAKAEIKQWESL